MGYPNKRVSMTDVHGEAQQGGALPAVIWHDYMSSVVGSPCVPFPSPTEPISYQPFFGHFATTGQSLQSKEGEERPAPGASRHRSHPGGRSGRGSGGGPPGERQGGAGNGAGNEHQGGGEPQAHGPPAGEPEPAQTPGHAPAPHHPAVPVVGGTGGAAPPG